MYSNKFAAKLVNIRQLCKKNMDNLNIFIVLSTYYFTFRLQNAHNEGSPEPLLTQSFTVDTKNRSRMCDSCFI